MLRALPAILLALTPSGCGRGPTPARTLAPVDPPQAAARADGLLTGTPACSGRGCHGDFEQPAAEPYRFAYTRFLHHDPHTNAYRSLESDLGREIGRKLGVNPTEDERCLACHTTPQAAAGKDPLSLAERAFGVGCEACHGAARDWLVEHREAGWAKKPAVSKEARGMNALSGHARRAETCAGCHVGAPADPKRGLPLRDMNHDMIAAGHPRLIFEYGSYLANLPKHWAEKDTREAFEERAWLVGQLASAKAAMALLADRAARAEGGVWPEFAEHDCYACHHGLHAPSWRQKRGYTQTAGAAGANRWYTALAPAITRSLQARAIDEKELQALMARRRPPADRVRGQGTRLADAFGTLARDAEKESLTPGLRQSLTKHLLAVGAEPRFGWDEYEQAALGLYVLAPADRRGPARDLLRALAWPADRGGPADAPPREFHAEVRKLFGALAP